MTDIKDYFMFQTLAQFLHSYAKGACIVKFLAILALCLLRLAANPQYHSFMTAQENAQGIPAFLLRAISNIESGRYLDGSVTAWPWTINVEGKGYVFKTKHEAIQAVEKFQRLGAKSIDVGIMQINLRHHPNAFRNLEEAFDPQLNIAYGAKFLKQLFLQHKSWNSAIGHYHSATPKFHNAYKQRVINQWMRFTKAGGGTQTEGPQLAQTVLKFDDVSDIKNEPTVKPMPSPEISSYARVKRVYYSLDGSTPARSINSEKSSYSLENTSSRQYYSLD